MLLELRSSSTCNHCRKGITNLNISYLLHETLLNVKWIERNEHIIFNKLSYVTHDISEELIL